MKQQGIGVYGIWYMVFVLLIPLYLYTSIPLFSQQFSVGLTGGIVTSQVDGDTWAGYNKAGFLAGGFVNKRFGEESKWSASFEIMYIMKGSRKVPHPDKGDFASYKLNLNYAEVPILLRYDFGIPDSSVSGRMKFSLEGGVAVGALVHSYEEDSFGQLTGGTPFQKSDYSAILGLSYHLSKHIGFNARTEYSIIPVRKGGLSTYYQNWTYRFLNPGYYNNLLTFSFRYQF
jgi:hypothetical protein